MSARARVIAFYLPQFHPISENDEWWGKGFTEWTVVSKAKRLFPGHHQPNLPGELGFYDLRVPETREAQAELARSHGIEGFCYWHYWFGGKRLLERPINDVVRSGQPNFPFCLGWANTPWTGEWGGRPDHILIEQNYGGEDDIVRHFQELLPTFRDNRYIRVDGKLLFYVHRTNGLPEPAQFVEKWNRLAEEMDLKGFHFVANVGDWAAAQAAGFDSYSCHWPNWKKLADYPHYSPIFRHAARSFRKLTGLPALYFYESAIVNSSMFNSALHPHQYPLVVPNWDNSPRVGKRGLVLYGSTPERFQVHVRNTLQLVEGRPPEQKIVFLKSWNEWAEGNYIEPDQRFGRAYLEILRDELMRSTERSL